MTTRITPPPSFSGVPKVSLDKNNFDELVYQNGIRVLVEDAIACPCKEQGSAHLSSCHNCLGTGWVFVNPYETRALVTSMNKNTKYKYWSPELEGTVSITMMSPFNNRLSKMDKITVLGSTSQMSEVVRRRRKPVEDLFDDFVFLSYKPREILSVFMFNGDNNSLIKLLPSQYSINGNNPFVLDLSRNITYPTNYNNSISVYYSHEVAYNVVDLPHDMRMSVRKNDMGQLEDTTLPIQGVARLSHLALGTAPVRDGTGLIDNSYE